MAELTNELRRWSGREEEMANRADEDVGRFNAEQRALYDAVLSAVMDQRPLRLFVDGKAGTGKTTVVRALCNRLRSMRRVVLPTATPAFAAQLYEGGRTTHSTFKVPVNESNEMLVAGITAGDSRSELIESAAMIVWDEAPMANRAVPSCVNDVLCDIMATDEPFGGKVIILLGDFRQTCPVIRRGSRAEVVEASIKSSPLWRYFTIHRLIHPIRNAEDPDFAAFVNSIGDGAGPDIPLQNLAIAADEDHMCNFVFPNGVLADPRRCVLRAILAPTNRQVDAYNDRMLDRLPGDRKRYFAADKIKESEEADLPPPEGILDYVMRNNLPGIPPHSISLKVGAVCRLLRNFSIDRGLVKNIRVVVTGLGTCLISVRVLNDMNMAGAEEVLILRITFEYFLHSGHTLARRQFPFAPTYATTFNSCQGLTLDRVGVDLTCPVFSHGQLYTAMSHIRNRTHAVFRLPAGATSTTNVTYHEILA
ncbi:helicase-like protein [Coprinopsis cinerea okayama7|uniref:ATP-dependent DNA helicase n=1 Tax=Coprinopsis cinerea (strain Okayama-7 / 130 / ATCC MYA-4618 / FGSC 9003) TaxID=240176 RepID=A8ND84_COPC7|nr:helicase-like protein [Coprinopsis cinerea okayama7\|eukprot:XP_001832725.1 helicase-like protein [Coprinopsis cinerea okayama7\